MEDSRTGMSWIGVLFVILVIWAIFGGFGNGGGFFGNRSGCDPAGCGRVSNCEVEKREIIDSARTQYLTEQQGSDTRTAVMGQASRIYEAQQSEKIFDLKMENMSLKNNFYTKELVSGLSQQLSDCCCGFNRRLDAIECDMLKKPNLYGVATTCSGQTIPGAFNFLNGCGCNTCGGNRNI